MACTIGLYVLYHKIHTQKSTNNTTLNSLGNDFEKLKTLTGLLQLISKCFLVMLCSKTSCFIYEHSECHGFVNVLNWRIEMKWLAWLMKKVGDNINKRVVSSFRPPFFVRRCWFFCLFVFVAATAMNGERKSSREEKQRRRTIKGVDLLTEYDLVWLLLLFCSCIKEGSSTFQ